MIEIRLFKQHTLKHNKYAVKTVDSKNNYSFIIYKTRYL